MKKKILGGIAVLAIAAFAAFNVNINAQEEALSAITLDNVEALASESGASPCGGPKTHGTCEARNTVNCKDTSGCS